MNNQNKQTQKDRILRSFAVAGFIATIIIIAWLGIKFVSILPTALSSLASVADTVYNYKKPEVIVVSNKSNVNDGERISLSWQVPSQKGTFAISYACAPGIGVEIQDKDKDGSKLLNCDTNYNLGAVSGVDLFLHSKMNRFADIDFTVDFLPNNEDQPTASDTRKISVINNDVALETEGDTSTTTPETKDDDKATTTVQPKKYVQVPIYGLPTSNPNGNTDLTARFINLGIFTNNEVFVPRTSIDHDEIGAIRFEVKNIGTKTSGTWAYVITLPNGTMYTSAFQNGLKPNETSTITIGFDMDGVEKGTKSTTLAVAVIGDSNLANNSFTTTIVIK